MVGILVETWGMASVGAGSMASSRISALNTDRIEGRIRGVYADVVVLMIENKWK